MGAAVHLKVAVRSLAQLTCRTGDIHFRYDDATDSREGIDTQKRLQRERGPTYEREAALKGVWTDGVVELELVGRVDGCDRTTGVVEEFKTTRSEAERLYTQAGGVHLAQLRLYAALLARAHPERSDWRLRLLYCDPDTDAVTPFEEALDAAALERFLADCCAALARWLTDLHRHRERRNARLADLKFPHATFRPAQRELAAEVFRTIRDGGALLFEAPTGSGKTLGAMFPTLLAIGRGNADRAVFLSSRTTGQAAAEATLARLRADDSLRRITIVAKAKICFMPEPVCDPATCEYARGYYDRCTPAIVELLAAGTMTRASIEAVARAHRVCPFELSLDAAVWADVVICDYNYVFDPVVRLKRLAGVTNDRIALLIDEAHQLGDRVRDALSTRIERRTLGRARKVIGEPYAARKAAALDRRFTELRRDAVRDAGLDSRAFECRVDSVDGFLRAAEALLDALTADAATPHEPAVTELIFALSRLMRVATWFDAERFAIFLRGADREIEIEWRCLDASAAIARTLDEFRAHVRFSATVSPFDLTGRAHGQPNARTLRVPSPFSRERLGVFAVPDVSTFYRHRSASVLRLVDVIRSMVDVRRGNYLVALPSFEYLDLVADAYAASDGAPHIVRQARGMSEAARGAFIAAFVDSSAPVVGFAVMGGLFTESIDLPDGALAGIAIVGIGLPPPSLERNEIEARLGEPDGRMLAYEQPAMARVVQAAGRLIRRETDRGVVCLVDPRFVSPAYRPYLPPDWRIVRATSDRLPVALAAFWQDAD
jgi:DNA excision repair protein ERCC-2